MSIRKFEILRVIAIPGGPGPERLWSVVYSGIVKKKKIERILCIVAKNEEEARHKADRRFGGNK